MSDLKAFIKHLGANYRIYTYEQLADLFTSDNHMVYVNEHRAALILDRIRFFATLLALFIPLWSVVDIYFLPANAAIEITSLRLLSASAFALMAWPWKIKPEYVTSLVMLGMLLINLPVTFFTAAHYLLGTTQETYQRMLAEFYSMLPFVSVAAVSLFPLTFREAIAFSLPLMLITAAGWYYTSMIPMEQLFPLAWLLLIILCLVIFASTIQLQHIISLVSRLSYDPITGALTRRSGIEYIIREFQAAVVQNDNFALALVDIDNADAIISDYDYATFDHAIIESAEILREDLRHNDKLVRWGEKSFLLILPNTDISGVQVAVKRIQQKGVGTLPDGRPVTASIGGSERMADGVHDWPEMIDLLMQRFNKAKTQGKDRAVLCQVSS